MKRIPKNISNPSLSNPTPFSSHRHLVLSGETTMPPPARFLQSNTATAAAFKTTDATTRDSDVVVILAALLCALICVIGLALLARCAWLRRSLSSSRRAPQPTLTPTKGLKKKALRSLPKTSFDAAAAAAGGRLGGGPVCFGGFLAGGGG
ncbi:probable E3 ubiquitin-protein ligase ATL44, partial [Phalaenopsis equestris]|uniref:probable E3 ubiquitin-protein ligase ATL44 n=1 Tax=Phalaenopsis equestris TaxID=78828 RepID=UPI0009E523D4